MENKEHAINRPPLFKEQNNDCWKQRMIVFFDTCHIDMWDIVDNGNYNPTKGDGIKIPISSWNEEKKKEYEKVHSCKSSKEIWDNLALAYEGALQWYELFKMQNHENIDQILPRQWKPQVTALKASKDL
ncbi:hypothetical protein CR513_26767, partial [Mucuna pruriens]